MSSKAYDLLPVDAFRAVGSETREGRADLLHAISPKARLEVESLAQRLFLTGHARLRKSVIFGELGAANSSKLWLTTGIAVTVAQAVDRAVRLVEVERDLSPSEDGGRLGYAKMCASVCNLTMETVAVETGGGQIRTLSDRVAQLSEANSIALIHLPDMLRSQDILAALAGSVDGIVLIVQERAIRKAAAENVASMLRLLGVPLFGVVLTDRTYPIPEPIYRRL